MGGITRYYTIKKGRVVGTGLLTRERLSLFWNQIMDCFFPRNAGDRV